MIRSQEMQQPRHGCAWVFSFGLLVGIVAPVLFTLAEPWRDPSGWRVWLEFDRIVIVLGHTAALAVLASIVAVPLGLWIGLVLERSTLRGRKLLFGSTILALFVPLPVYAIAWQIVLSSWLPAWSSGPGTIAWRPWNQGLLPAALIHGLAAIPWVAVIVAVSLKSSDPALDDDALMTGGPRRLLRWVLWPRMVLAIVAASAFVVAQSASEIVITDTMMVRTFAEEVYARIVGDPSGVAASVAAALPIWLLVSLSAILVLHRIAQRFFPTESIAETLPRIHLPGAESVWLIVGLVFVVPMVALIWKAGESAGNWQFANVRTQLSRTVSLFGTTILVNMLAASIAGYLTARSASWLCFHFRNRSSVIVFLMLMLAVLPSPIVGLGLKELIGMLLTVEDELLGVLGLQLAFPPLRSLLYDQASPLPGIWAIWLRFLPVALAIAYPAVRAIPHELHDLAAMDGVDTWRFVGRPLLRHATRMAAIAVAALSLGEVGASKLVVPPQWNVFVLELFNQMHYGTESGVAAMAIVQVAISGIWTLLALRTLDR